MSVIPFPKRARPHVKNPGLSERQLARLADYTDLAIDVLTYGDERPRFFALVLLTYEGRDADGMDIVTTDMVGTTPRHILHDQLRDWLYKETQ